MSVDTVLAANVAAGRITVQHAARVASQYETWLDAQPLASSAIDALLAASADYTDPSKVTAVADLALVPTIVGALAPATGVAAGNTTVTITGTNLTGTTGVTFGGTAGTTLVNVSDTSVTVHTPAKAAGTYDVVLTTPKGTATKTGGFIYT